jgi:hypothetical protein
MRTDGTKVIVAFRNFANAPKNGELDSFVAKTLELTNRVFFLFSFYPQRENFTYKFHYQLNSYLLLKVGPATC